MGEKKNEEKNKIAGRDGKEMTETIVEIWMPFFGSGWERREERRRRRGRAERTARG